MGTPDRTEEGLWIRLPEWILMEAELPEPAIGAEWPNTGVRVVGVTEDVPGAIEGIVSDVAALRGRAVEPPVQYLVTGRVVHAQDLRVDYGSGPQLAGAELVLNVKGRLFQAQVGAQPCGVALGSQLSVRGELCVVGNYEWDAFELVDTRAAWLVRESRRLADGDYLVRLLLA